MLKKFKESDEFFRRVDLSRSNIYFEIRLHKFLCKFTTLKKSALTSSYFKINFKLIKKICMANVDIFREKDKVFVKNKIFVSLFFILVYFIIFCPCLDNFV